MMLEEYDNAVADYKTIIDGSPDALDAVIGMGACYMHLDDLHNAMDRCMLALDMLEEQEYPRAQQYRLHTLLADIYDGIGESDTAEYHRKIAKRLKT